MQLILTVDSSSDIPWTLKDIIVYHPLWGSVCWLIHHIHILLEEV